MSATDNTWVERSCPELAVEFRHPADWVLVSVESADATGAVLLGPRNKADTFNVSISIVRRQRGDTDVDAWAAEALSRSRGLPQVVMQELARKQLGDWEAAESNVSYYLPLPPNSVGSVPTLIRERWLFLAVPSAVYEITYAGSEEEFPAFIGIFEDVVRSLRHTICSRGTAGS